MTTGIQARLRLAPLHARLLLGFGLVLALCAAQSVFAFRNAADNVAPGVAQHRIEDITALANQTHSALLQMEAGYRGYLLNGDEDLLASYRAASQAFSADIDTMLDTDDQAMLARWRTLDRRVAVWRSDIIEPGIARRQQALTAGSEPFGVANSAFSQQDISGIQRLLDTAIAADQRALSESQAASIDANNRLMAVLLWGTLGVLGAGLAVAGVSARDLARAIAEVHAGERRYAQMFANNPAIKLLLDATSGAMVEANQAACNFYGYPRGDLLQLNLADISMRPPAAVAESVASITTGRLSSFLSHHRLASGELRDVEVESSRVDDLTGRVLLYCIIHDVTERKLAEDALRASEERFRKQYKGFPLPTYSWLQVEEDFVLQDFNDAAEAITDGLIRDAVGSTASQWYAHQPQIQYDLQACVDEQRTLTRETRFRYRSTEPERHLGMTYVFVPPLTVMLHTEDITAAKQAEKQREAMAQSEKLRALGQMASGIAHDLNQSLMLVASYSELARQALVQDPPKLSELEDLLTTTTQAALDGGETVKRLLLFTRAAPEHDNTPVDLSSVVHDAAQLTAPRWRDAAQAEGRPISLVIEADGHPMLQGSPGRMRELMTNLIFNAVDALPRGGTIHLRVTTAAGHGIVEVVDSGLGMSAEVQARLFEPFFTTKGEGGTGLGLAMVFGIVERHGGRIQVQSGLGQGTTFRLTFPLMDGTLVGAQSPESSAQLELARPLRVLAVDDEPMMTKAVVRMLKPYGHLVSVATSGEEALEKLRQQTFDVVVSDMGMGAGMNGWELAEAVRTRWPGVRFLLATGWGAAVDPIEARTRGVEAVLSKPYHPKELLHVLANTQVAA